MTKLTTDMNTRERRRFQRVLTETANTLHDAARSVIAERDEDFLVALLKADLLWRSAKHDLGPVLETVVEYDVPETPEGADKK
jgi:hypothetical protein